MDVIESNCKVAASQALHKYIDSHVQQIKSEFSGLLTWLLYCHYVYFR